MANQRATVTETPRFPAADEATFQELAAEYARCGSRRITEVHLHHTWRPNRRLFDELTVRLGSSEAAGHELVTRMWRFHTQDKGWSDIAQHVTIDPKGTIWLGRSWDRQPASAVGFNGSTRRGPFMIEMIGDFDRNQEAPSKKQWKATLSVIAAVQQAFGLPANSLSLSQRDEQPQDLPRFRARQGNGHRRGSKSCTASARTARGGRKRDAGPLAAKQREAVRLVTWLLDRGATPAGERALDAAGQELPEEQMDLTDRAALSGERDRLGQRGGADPEGLLTAEVLHDLRRHVINLNQGVFSQDGRFTTTKAEAEEIVTRHLADWAKGQEAAGQTPHVMVYAHGGLVSEEAGLLMAYKQHKFWLANGVYPIFFVWETGGMETFWQLLEDKLRRDERDLAARGDISDWAVERIVRLLGQNFWQTMKVSAERASDTGDRYGAHYLAGLLKDLQQDAHAGLQVHAIGHSAGSIFHAYFLRECDERKLPVQTLQFLAPACTTALFKEEVLDRVNGKKIGHFALYTMDRHHERRDPTVPAYGKSLLYLVSRGFEERSGEPILGLQESIYDDPDLEAFLGLGSHSTQHAEVVWSPVDAAARLPQRSSSTTHGGFDDDPDTMESALLRILGVSNMGGLTRYPSPDRDRGPARLFAPLSSVLPPGWEADLLSAARPPLPPAPLPIPVAPSPLTPSPAAGAVPLTGTRRALCIGIDAYPLGAALAGCVADAHTWKTTLEGFNFQVELLLDAQATRQGMIDAIRGLVDRAGPGDVIVLHYSGHGTQLPDDSGDEQDQKDEALVPYDGIDGHLLVDDELRVILANLRAGVRMTCFFDCCHAGSNTRFAIGSGRQRGGLTERFLAATPAMVRAHRAFRATSAVRGGFTAPEPGEEMMHHVQFSACQDFQTAKEQNGQGWFTRLATGLIAQGGGTRRNLDFQENLEAAFAPHAYLNQSPRLEGPIERKRQAFLAGIVV